MNKIALLLSRRIKGQFSEAKFLEICTAGIYFLADRFDEIIYIGKSVSVGSRLCNHAIYSDKFSKLVATAHVLPTCGNEMDEFERSLIAYCRPRFNIMLKGKDAKFDPSVIDSCISRLEFCNRPIYIRWREPAERQILMRKNGPTDRQIIRRIQIASNETP